MADDKTLIMNVALASVGEGILDDIEGSSPNAVKSAALIETVINELLAEDWFFNRKRAELTPIYKLEVDTAPSPAAWAVGATITGASSGVTCDVVKVVSDTEYWVTEPTDDFTDGEVLSDGTNSVDCATGYPDVSDQNDVVDFGNYDYVYQIPSDCLKIRRLVSQYYDSIKYPYVREGPFILCNEEEAFLLYNSTLNDSEGDADVDLMPRWFHRLISARLAYILAPNVTQNTRIKQKVETDLEKAWLNAYEQNGEEAYHKFEGNDDWAEGAHDSLP